MTDATTSATQRSYLHRLRFGVKLALVPLITTVAFAIMVASAYHYQSENAAHLTALRHSKLPALEASRELERALESIRQGFQDAAGTGSTEALSEVQRRRRAFDEAFGRMQRTGTRSPDDLASLRRYFDDYYDFARTTTSRVISDGMTDEVVQAVPEMSSLHARIRDVLARGTRRDRTDVAAAFSAATLANRRSLTMSFGVAIVVLSIIIVLSSFLTRLAMDQVDRVGRGFERMARGDFSTPIEVLAEDELGQLGHQVNSTSETLAELVRSIRTMSSEVNAAAAQMAAAATEHQRGASEQSSAVEETLRTMQTILASTEQIIVATDTVFRNAEQTLGKNQLIAESIVSLSAKTDGITEVLSTIKDIANKAELLALNAALEGTKAGEIGRGFSLVATQMQRLAENVQRAVSDIRNLTEQIRRASGASVVATEEGTKLATDTTRSAREIRLTMQQHQSGTQQVSSAMNEISGVAQQSAASSRQILTSSEDLAKLSQRLLEAASRFRLGDVTSAHDAQ